MDRTISIPKYVPFEIKPRLWNNEPCVQCGKPAPYVDGVRSIYGPSWFFCFDCEVTTEVRYDDAGYKYVSEALNRNIPVIAPSLRTILDTISDSLYIQLYALKDQEPYRVFREIREREGYHKSYICLMYIYEKESNSGNRYWQIDDFMISEDDHTVCGYGGYGGSKTREQAQDRAKSHIFNLAFNYPDLAPRTRSDTQYSVELIK